MMNVINKVGTRGLLQRGLQRMAFHSSIRAGNNQRFSGRVKWFNNTKGYGFITRDDNQSDIFVHASHIRGTGFKELAPFENVTFLIEEKERGLNASDVVVVTEDEANAVNAMGAGAAGAAGALGAEFGEEDYGYDEDQEPADI